MSESLSNHDSPLRPEELEPKKMPRNPRKPKAKLPAWLAWLRAIGGLSLVLGAIGVMPPKFFWYSVALFHLGLVVVGLDLYFEPNLSRRFKIMLGVCLAAGFVWFNAAVVLSPAPFNLGAATLNVDYSSGAAPAPGGIHWSPIYTELDVYMSNPTDSNYDDVELLVKPDAPVAAIEQLSTLSDVSFENYWGYSSWLTLDSVGIPWVLFATDAGYNVHCGRIPRHSSLRIVMAIVHFKKDDPEFKKDNQDKTKTTITFPAGTSPEEGLFDAILRTSKGDRADYWYGLAKNLSKFGSKTKATKVAIVGSFTTGNRRRSVKREVVPQQ